MSLTDWRKSLEPNAQDNARWWQRYVPKMTLILLSAMIAAMVYFFVQTAATERNARAESVATSDLLIDLRRIVTIGVDAETGSRGYILTEEPIFLEPYSKARLSWLKHIDMVEEKFEALGEDENALATQRIRGLAEKKLAFIERVVGLTRAGQRDVAIAEVKTRYGKQLLDNIRDVVRQLEQDQRQKLIASVERAKLIELWMAGILIGLLMLVLALTFFSFRQERKASRVALLDQEARLLRQSKEQADLVAQELNHRIKNLFAVILSLITLSARGGTDVPSTIEKIRNRIHALSLAHSVSQGGAGIRSVEITELLASTLAPYRVGSNTIIFEGPSLDLPTATITPLGLIMHELATNALKYGALSKPEGTVMLRWEVSGGEAAPEIWLRWIEEGGKLVGKTVKHGFGSSMIAAAVQQLNGRLEQIWHEQGLEINLRFPRG